MKHVSLNIQKLQIFVAIIIASGLTLTNASLSASDFTNRSFLNIQDSRDKAAHRSFVRSLHRAGGDKQTVDDEDNSFTFMITPQFGKTFGEAEMGKFFGVGSQNVVPLQYNGDGINQVRQEFMFRFSDNTLPSLNAGDKLTNFNPATVSLNPRQTSVGAHFDAIIGLAPLAQGLSLSIGTALLRNKNDVETIFNDGAIIANQASTISDYLKGIGQSTVQKALSFGLLSTNSNEKTQSDDIDLRLRYVLVDKPKSMFGAFISCRIPTGNEPEAIFLFEPLVGTRHWRFGGGFYGDATINESQASNSTLMVHFDINYQYAFHANEKRLLDIKNEAWGKYHLSLQAGKPFATVANPNVTAIANQFNPLANVLAQDMTVYPGSIFTATFMASYNQGMFACDGGYHFCFKHAEDNKFKKEWVNNQYYRFISNASWGTAGVNIAVRGVSPDDATNATFFQAVNKTDLEINHPSQTFHTLFFTMGILKRDAEYPWTLALGSEVTVSNDQRAAPYSWDVFGKIGISF